MGRANHLANLRAQAKRAYTNVGRKLSRQSQRGITDTSSIDFRPPRTNIDRYNAKQLRGFISRSQSFLSRSNQYVPDSNGKPISTKDWAKYKAAEASANATRRARFNAIKDIKTPSGQMTVGEHVSIYHSNINKKYSLTNSVLNPIERDPSQITSKRSLERLTRSLQREGMPQQTREQSKEWRKQAKEMLSVIGPQFDEKIDKLSERQFSALWHGTSFLNSAGLAYELTKGYFFSQNVYDNSRADVDALLDWASHI